jgi:voltage-gated sodium channel
VVALAGRVADSPRFQNFIVAVIVVTAAVIGLETSEALTERYGGVFHAVDTVIQTIFIVEIAIRLTACWPRLLGFFRDGWNVFDFTVVVVSLLPQAGPFAMVARLARLMRVTRLVSIFPELRLIIGTMLRSIPSMGHVIMLLGLLLYVYGVLGVYLFGETDSEHWGNLGAALLTLFQILTLEGWVEVQDILIEVVPWAWIYFGTFVFVGVFVVVNLFIAVVINNLESVKLEHQQDQDRANPQAAVLAAIDEIRTRLDAMERQLRDAAKRPADVTRG